MNTQVQLELRLIEKNLTISKVFTSIRNAEKLPTRMCTLLENGHDDLNEIILHYSTAKLQYQKTPSVKAQMMLTIAPLSASMKPKPLGIAGPVE